MTGGKLDADALLALAIETLRAEIMTDLSAEKRYAAAMIASALEIVQRQINGEAEAAQWELLDPIYGEGEGSLRQLAEDIRKGEISVDSHSDISRQLRSYLLAELKVTNPRFLKARGVRG